MTEIKVSFDHVNPNIRYLSYEMPGDGVGVMDLGDGETRPVFPPRGQVTHEYAPGDFRVTVTRDGKNFGSVRFSVGKKKTNK